MFKVGDKVEIAQCEGDPSCDLVGNKSTITRKYVHSSGEIAYELKMNTGTHY